MDDVSLFYLFNDMSLRDMAEKDSQRVFAYYL